MVKQPCIATHVQKVHTKQQTGGSQSACSVLCLGFDTNPHSMGAHSTTCVFLCVCVEVQPTTCLLALQARLPSTPEGALWCFAVFMCKCSACKYVPVACDLSCFPHEAVPHLSIYGGTAMRAKARFHSLKIKPGHIKSYTVTRKPQWGSLTWVKHMQWLSTFFIWTPVGLYNVYTFMVLFLLKY